MFFRKDPRKKALVELALRRIEKMLWEMQGDGKDLAKMKLKKYQKTHFTTCTCPQCVEAKHKNNPHLKGILEDGFKIYVGEGSAEPN
ncbi:MAG: hypothetical protein IIA14_01435 [SAR324 cluster bacterium]|nr:hypothetical protein [SAR324 cluster bacterium]